MICIIECNNLIQFVNVSTVLTLSELEKRIRNCYTIVSVQTYTIISQSQLNVYNDQS